jgi:lipopolysaccharide export system permease protein
MKTVRRLFYADILSSVAFVSVAFLSLFFFIDFVEELARVGSQGYTAVHAALYSLLELPGHLYELLPISVLIGTIYTLARLAQSSEYTILRTGGLGPGRALSMLACLGLAFGVLTFVVGDYLAPLSDQQATRLKAYFSGGRIGTAGAWLKDRQPGPQGERAFKVTVGSVGADGLLNNVRIFEFDEDNREVRRITAKHAHIDAASNWTLQDVRVTHWTVSGLDGSARATEDKLPTLVWPSTLSSSMMATAVLPPGTTSTLELLRYVNHLSDNEQAAQRHEIQFWKRAFYPLASLVMIGLALPFAYLQSRSGSVSLKVFGGIMLGISFVLLNNVAGHIGLLKDWTPWMVAAAPSALYMLMSMAAFAWLVRYR